MQTRKFILLLLLSLSTIFIIVNPSSAQIVKEERGNSFKWVLVSDKTSGEYGAETSNGSVLIPKGKHFIIFHESNGGYFELRSNGLVAAYSKEGNELIPFSNGYDRIVKHKEYFSVRRNGLEGACDFKGNEIIKPQYSILFYSSIDGFNTQKEGKYVPLGIKKGNDDFFQVLIIP